MSGLLLVGGLALLWFAVTGRADALIRAVVSPGGSPQPGGPTGDQPGPPGSGVDTGPTATQLDPGWHYTPDGGWQYQTLGPGGGSPDSRVSSAGLETLASGIAPSWYRPV